MSTAKTDERLPIGNKVAKTRVIKIIS